MTQRGWILGRTTLGLALLATLSSCANRVWMMVPPKVDLRDYGRIGLVEFHGEDPDLRQRATALFEEMILEARPGSHVVSVRAEGAAGSSPHELDPEKLRDLAERYDLDAVFIGSLELSKITPTIGIAVSLVEVNARAEITGTLSARLVDAEGGETLWLRSAEDRVTVAQGSVDTDGDASIGMTVPEGTHAALVRSLAGRLTGDFRAQYFKKKLEDIPPHYQQTYPEGVEVWVPPSEVDAGN